MFFSYIVYAYSRRHLVVDDYCWDARGGWVVHGIRVQDHGRAVVALDRDAQRREARQKGLKELGHIAHRSAEGEVRIEVLALEESLRGRGAWRGESGGEGGDLWRRRWHLCQLCARLTCRTGAAQALQSRSSSLQLAASSLSPLNLQPVRDGCCLLACRGEESRLLQLLGDLRVVEGPLGGGACLL